jgi:hypothetical protein
MLLDRYAVNGGTIRVYQPVASAAQKAGWACGVLTRRGMGTPKVLSLRLGSECANEEFGETGMNELKRQEVNIDKRTPASFGAVVNDAKGRITEVLGQATDDIVTLALQDAGRIAAQYKPELLVVAKSLGALGVAAVAGLLVVFFATIALTAFLATFIPLYLAAALVALLWAAIAGIALVFLRTHVKRILNRHRARDLAS